MTSGVKRPSYRRIFSMAIPIILQSSISGCATLVDNLMVGSLGGGVISGVATTCNPTKIGTETFGDIYDVVTLHFRGKVEMTNEGRAGMVTVLARRVNRWFRKKTDSNCFRCER